MDQAISTASQAETSARADIYQRITDRIVTSLQKGVGGWRMPWHVSGEGAALPVNAVTRRAYRGVNTVVLWATAQAEAYPSAVWATYRQWQELGAQVRKGEQSSPVVFWKISGTEEQEDAEGAGAEADGRRSRVFARGYAVFNASQVEGYAAPAVPVLPEVERIGHAETFFGALGADIRHGGNHACYVPGLDRIRMPLFEAFRDPVAYYATLAHEAVHWTGHEGRCARDLRGRFGEAAYAAEELVAELGAAFLCADMALASEPRPDHAAYVASWLKVLRGDKRAIFTAAAKAQAAAGWMHQRQQRPRC